MPTAAPQNIRLVRPAPPGACCEQVLPVNLSAITSGGDPTTNYQLMPNDRIIVYRDPIVRLTVFLDRLAAPFQTVVSSTLQYSFTAQVSARFSRRPVAGAGGSGGRERRSPTCRWSPVPGKLDRRDRRVHGRSTGFESPVGPVSRREIGGTGLTSFTTIRTASWYDECLLRMRDRLVVRRGNAVDAHGDLWLSAESRCEREHPLATSSVTKRCDSAVRRRDRASASRSGRAAVVVVFVCALGLVWEFRRPWFQGNLGIVDPGRVIRSAQPTSQLSRLGQGLSSQVDPQPARGKSRRIGGTRPRCGRPGKTAWRSTTCR